MRNKIFSAVAAWARIRPKLQTKNRALRAAAALGLCLLFSSALELKAGSFTGGRLTAFVPDGWSVMYKADYKQIVLTSPDASFSIGIMVRDLAGRGVEEAALELAQRLDGQKPQKSADGSYYTIDAVVDEVSSSILLMGRGDKLMTYVESGAQGRFEAEANAVFSSLSSSDAAEQALFDLAHGR